MYDIECIVNENVSIDSGSLLTRINYHKNGKIGQGVKNEKNN